MRTVGILAASALAGMVLGVGLTLWPRTTETGGAVRGSHSVFGFSAEGRAVPIDSTATSMDIRRLTDQLEVLTIQLSSWQVDKQGRVLAHCVSDTPPAIYPVGPQR